MDKRALRSNSSNSSPATQEKAKGSRSLESPVTLHELKAALADSVAQINERVDAIVNERLERLRSDIKSDFEAKIKDLEAIIYAQAKEIDHLQSTHAEVVTDVDSLAYTIHQQMKKDIQNNIVISGIPEEDDEDEVPAKAEEVLEKLDCSTCEVVQHSRVGRAQNDGPRLLKLSFRSLRDKIRAVRNASRLRRDKNFLGIYVNPDYTVVERKERKRLRDESIALKKEHPNSEVVLRRGKLLLNGNLVGVAHPHRLLFREEGSRRQF